MSQASRRFFLVLLAIVMLVVTVHGQGQTGGPGGPQSGPQAGSRGSGGFGAVSAQTPPKPLIANAKPVRSCESLATVSLPDTTIESAAVAPAAFGLQPDSLAAVKDLPVMIVQGDADTMVPVAGTRRWVDKLNELRMTYTYNEIPGGDHGSVILDGNPGINAFFSNHSKPASH